MAGNSLTGVYLVQGGQMARVEPRDGRLALAAMHLLQDGSHLTSDDVDRRMVAYQSGMDEAAERKRAAINLLPLRVVVPDAPPRREWPVVTTVECGLRRHDNRVAQAAAHLLKAERAKDDGRAALRESRRTLERAQEERDFAERRWRRGVRLLARGRALCARGMALVGFGAASIFGFILGDLWEAVRRGEGWIFVAVVQGLLCVVFVQVLAPRGERG